MTQTIILTICAVATILSRLGIIYYTVAYQRKNKYPQEYYDKEKNLMELKMKYEESRDHSKRLHLLKLMKALVNRQIEILNWF